jgi:hypothetical protein
MNLTPEQAEIIVSEALAYLDRSYEEGFTCLDFARTIYKTIGIEIPKLWAGEPPPRWFNVDSEELAEPPIGHIVFLRRKQTKAERCWTHVVIVLPERRCIHCSHFFGGKVCISSLEKVFALYDFVPSR